MEVSITDITDVEKEISIRATAQELIPHFELAYKRHQPKIEIKGFRKGKAPLDLVKKVYGESIEYNSLDQVASDVYRQVVTERHIHPIGEPVLTEMNYQRGDNLSFKIKYEIKPAIELKEYKNIAVEKPVHRVTDDEVEGEIKRILHANSTLTETETADDMESIVTADVQQLDESGSPLIGKKTADARLYLADESVFKEIRDSLKGARAGDVRRVTVEPTHEDHKHTNHLEISIKKIEKVNLPELTDELVKKVTKDKVQTPADLRSQIRKDLEQYWTDRSDRRLLDEIIGEIVRRHEFVVPESLVRGYLDSLMEEMKNRYPNKKLPADFKEQEFRDENRGFATFQTKWFLIRERIIESEGLKIEQADLEKQAEIDAPKLGIDKERLVKFYTSSEATVDRMLTEKLHKLLKDSSQITEKEVKEF